MGLVRWPVCSEQSWAADTVSLLSGKRRLGQDVRISTDISVRWVSGLDWEKRRVEGGFGLEIVPVCFAQLQEPYDI